MAETLRDTDPPVPDLSHLVTEDDRPVDNRFSERQFKLLTQSLLEGWEEGKPFEALSDVGLFYRPDNDSRIVPDFLLALGVTPRPVTGAKEDRSYFTWIYGKPPDLVVEIVSNREGEELTRKLEIYESIRVTYYAVYDPFHELGSRALRLFQLVGGRYVEMADPHRLPGLGLGLAVWEGEYLDVTAPWLRFVDREGRLIPTGRERAEEERARADEERSRADEERARADGERARADGERARAERLAARLRELGHEPEPEQNC